MNKQEILTNITKPQSTKAFQELTSGWRKVNGKIIKDYEQNK